MAPVEWWENLFNLKKKFYMCTVLVQVVLVVLVPVAGTGIVSVWHRWCSAVCNHLRLLSPSFGSHHLRPDGRNLRAKARGTFTTYT